jgi:DNA uptake protein ComE-like DNA-binding protein
MERLKQEREERDRAMEQAYGRLKEIEIKAREAEQRAADAELLAQRKAEEAERERRLREVLERVAKAEARAKEAERRAQAAETAAAQSVDTAEQEAIELPPPPPAEEPPSPPPPVQQLAPQPEVKPPEPEVKPPEPEAKAPEIEAEPEAGKEEEEEDKGGILGRTVGAILGVGPEKGEGAEAEKAEAKPELEDVPITPPDEAETEVQPAVEKPSEAEPTPDADAIDLNSATFEQLREIGFSVTQSTRVITYRERQGGFSSVNDLDEVPGMSRSFRDKVKSRLKV